MAAPALGLAIAGFLSRQVSPAAAFFSRSSKPRAKRAPAASPARGATTAWPLSGWQDSTFLVAILGAALLWIALPPVEAWPLAWIAPVPWILLVRRERWAGRRSYLKLWAAGFCFWLAALHWLRLPYWATAFGWLALAGYLGIYLPLFVGLTRIAVHQLRLSVVLAAPVVWMGLELARAHLLSGFRMAAISHTQFRWLAVIQISDLGGDFLVDFLIVLVAACLGRALPLQGARRTLWPLAVACAALLATLVYGNLRLTVPDNPPRTPLARVVLVQGSIDTQFNVNCDEEMFRQYFQLSQQALKKYSSVDLLVWPESMYPHPRISYDPDARVPAGWSQSQDEFRRRLEELAPTSPQLLADTVRALDVPMIVGLESQHFAADGMHRSNSAMYVDRSGVCQGRYNKMHLVLFGEYTPLVNTLPLIGWITPLASNCEPGDQPTLFRLGNMAIAPNICYETVLSHVIRRQVNTLAQQTAMPDVLVNLTNDGWFWGSSELDMHLVCGVFRAIECRRPLLIAANTGFSATIDGDGRIVQRAARRKPDLILAEVLPDTRRSPYLRYGDLPAGACLAACLTLLIVGLFRVARPMRANS